MKLARIAAVVVTYNRRALLDRMLSSLAKQTRMPDGVIIIDNASTDGTSSLLQERCQTFPVPMDVVTLAQNTGGAGGFHRGVRDAYDAGYDAVWLMDDDTMPEPRALELLERDLLRFEVARDVRPAFICSTVLWRDGELCEMNVPRPCWDWPRFLSSNLAVGLVESCSFVSVLIRREKIALAGYPIADFFIWYDDVEYTSRLSRLGVPGLLSVESIVRHELPENKGVNFAQIAEGAVWKYAYGLRNEAAVILARHGWLRYLLFATDRALLVLRQGLTFRAKARLVRALVSAARFRLEIEYPRAPR